MNIFRYKYQLARQAIFHAELSSNCNSPTIKPEYSNIKYIIKIVGLLKYRESINYYFYKLKNTSPNPVKYIFKRISRILICRNYEYEITSQPVTSVNYNSKHDGNRNIFKLLPRYKNKNKPYALLVIKYNLEAENEHIYPHIFVDSHSWKCCESIVELPVIQKSYNQQLIEIHEYSDGLYFSPGMDIGNFSMKQIKLEEKNWFSALWFLKKIKGITFSEGIHMLLLRQKPGVYTNIELKSPYQHWLNKYDSEANYYIDTKYIQENYVYKFTIIIKLFNYHELIFNMIDSIHQLTSKNYNVILAIDENIYTKISEHINKKEYKNIIISDKSDYHDLIYNCNSDYFIYIDDIVIIAPDILSVLSQEIIKNNNTDIIYTDHDYIYKNKRINPVFKSDLNHELLLQNDYTGNLIIIKKSVFIKSIIHFKKRIPGIYELLLWVIEHTPQENIKHIAAILYHNTNTANIVSNHGRLDEQIKHVKRYFDRNNISAQVCKHPISKKYVKVEYNLPVPFPHVHIVILTRNKLELLSNLINGIIQKTNYKNISITIIDNDSDEKPLLDYLGNLTKNNIKVIRVEGEFNYSALNNLAMNHVNSEYVCLMNNDISVINPDWLKVMMGHLLCKNVGIVGAKLLYENNTVQHAGMVTGIKGYLGFYHKHYPGYSEGYNGRLVLTQEVSAVAGACMLIKKSLYDKVGGMDEINMKIAFSDIDLCLKIRKEGYKIIWSPYAELYHLESASRGPDFSNEKLSRWENEYEYFKSKWGNSLFYDPYFNINLSLMDEGISYAFPPRISMN